MTKKLEFKRGDKFGRLTVMSEDSPRRNNSFWKCICECGKKVSVKGNRLKSGRTKSCGCLSADLAKERRLLPKGESALNQTYLAYTLHAKRRGLPFEIDKETFAKLTRNRCFYCDSTASNIYKNKSKNGDYKYNGLDRIDNSKGYTIKNVVPCCCICNVMKGQMTIFEFKKQIDKIIKNWIMKVK